MFKPFFYFRNTEVNEVKLQYCRRRTISGAVPQNFAEKFRTIRRMMYFAQWDL